MKKFVDKTNSELEPAIKVGNAVPADAVNLGFYSTSDVSPKNNVSILDLSGIHAENINQDSNTSKLMYANELGILEDSLGNSFIESDEVYISDVFFNEQSYSQQYLPADLQDKKYTYNYYVSRHFTLLRNGSYVDAGLDYYLDQRFVTSNIKVLDKNGDLYSDPENGTLKYSISFESFLTEKNYTQNEIPNKIIVFISEPDPGELTLVYDKVEVNKDGIWSGQILQYRETINYVPVFNLVQEETEVVDSSNLNKKIFAVKRNTKKAAIDGSVSDPQDKQIYVGRKAVDDNRVFEVFNWRIVARISNSVRFSDVNNGIEPDSSFIRTKNVNVGVLYSSAVGKDRSKISPYSLVNLQNSSFNIARYTFVNPHATVNNKNSADYWLVDIDSVTDEQILSYDFLVCDLHWDLTESQSSKIRSFANNAGTIVFDCSSARNQSLAYLDSTLVMSDPDYTISSGSSFTYNTTNVYLNSTLNNAFGISSSEFATDCGIFGLAKNVNNTYKRYKYFSNTNLTNIMSITGTSKRLFAALRFARSTDSLVAGNVVVSTSGFLKYCNDIYSGSALVPTSNNGEINISSSNTNIFSNLVEGPYKFLYNCLVVGLNDKIESKRTYQDIRSSVHVFSGAWNTDWIINDAVAFDDEKEQYFKYSVVDDEQRYVREIVSKPKTRYIEEASAVSSIVDSVFYDQNENNIDLYIEYTNDNVSWTNSSTVSSTEKEQLASSYNVIKISNKNISMDVYTTKESPSLRIPSGMGPYVIKNKVTPSRRDNNFETAVVRAASVNYARNYPFTFQVSSFSTSGNDYATQVNATVSGTAQVSFNQNHTFSVYAGEKEIGRTTTTTARVIPSATIPYPVSDFESSQSGRLRYSKNVPFEVSNVYNAYAYSYDIDNGNSSSQYIKGSSGDYVRYIQATLTVAGYKTAVDGSFGNATDSNVRKFQTAKLAISDGKVDSQTKSRLAQVWLDNADKVDSYSTKYPSIAKYIDGALYSANVIDGLQGLSGFRLINFTGISNADKDPDTLRVWIGFKLPDSGNVQQINAINIGGQDFGTSVRSPDYNGFKILGVNISSDYDFVLRNSNWAKPYSGRNAGHIIELANNQDYKGKYVSILLQGSKLGGKFGATAEGIAITGISTTCVTKPITTGEVDTVTTIIYGPDYVSTPRTKTVNASVSFSIPVENISFTDTVISIDSETIKRYGTITSLQAYSLGGEDFTDNLLTYSNVSLSMNNPSYKPDAARAEVVNISIPKSISVNTAAISTGTVRKSNNQVSQPDSLVNLQRTGNEIKLSCNVAEYNASTTYVDTQNINSYYLKNPYNNVIGPGKNTVNYFDGVQVLSNQQGSPVGLPNQSLVSAQVTQDIDVYYSDMSVQNVSPRYSGMQYGFYDNKEKQFLGKTISYNKYRDVGPQNVYIGVLAYDYDGNLNTLVDHSGASSGDVFEPISVPGKIIYPVYKVSFKKSNKIQILDIPANLQKTEPWPIFISSGSFTKEVDVLLDRPREWLSLYNGQRLTAKYDTSNLKGVAWSKIFGRGYFDIKGEHPIINNSRSITIRRAKLVTVHEHSSDLSKFGGHFRQIVKVYTRESTESSWSEVPYSLIKNINVHTGTIEFINPIISSNEKLTKVDYTIKQSGIGVMRVNSDAIPINPFLNKDTVKINKPLYIYLKPKEIYKQSNIQSQPGEVSASVMVPTIVEEYTNDSLINFTYNNNIFNPDDALDYDPFAVLIGVIYVINTFNDDNFLWTDLRVKGGGVTANTTTNNVVDKIPMAQSYWDVYPALGEAYPKAGYVIIKIPNLVKKNFANPNEVYDIIRRNITAGVVFELQDMEGNDWSSNVITSSWNNTNFF